MPSIKTNLKPENGNNMKPEILYKHSMSNSDFNRFSKFIQVEYGIKMPSSKKTALEVRLYKRLKALGMESFGKYCDYVFSPKGIECEIPHMIDAVTTNMTLFFRDTESYDYLVRTVLPNLINEHEPGVREKLMLWSAGCASGEEPYTLAMVLSEFTGKHHGFGFSILATDVSTRVLEIAKRAIYDQDRTTTIPTGLKMKYLMRSKDREKRLVRIVPELRSLVKFRTLNLMEDFGMREPMDIIFCRNVIIYFNRIIQEKLLKRICDHLKPGGYIFMGSSENLVGFNIPLEHVYSTIYRKPI